jgi:hypothetical protein
MVFFFFFVLIIFFFKGVNFSKSNPTSFFSFFTQVLFYKRRYELVSAFFFYSTKLLTFLILFYLI